MADGRHGVFTVGPHIVALPAHRIHEIFVLGDVRVPPSCPPHQRGVAVLRGSALPALDLRVCLGHISAKIETEQLVNLLTEREEDHRRWLTELEASVREDRPFGLATDPRKCRFGQWYYAFKTDDAVLRGELARFERPHAEIHALALEIEKLRASGGREEALARIGAARSGLLASLLALFEVARRAMREAHKEVGVTVELGGRRSVLIVDRAEAVADLDAISRDDDPLAAGSLQVDLVTRLARWRGSTAPVLVLDVDRLGAFAA